MCDLQELLDEALQLDFNIQAEDDSPYQVGAHGRVVGGAARAQWWQRAGDNGGTGGLVPCK